MSPGDDLPADVLAAFQARLARDADRLVALRAALASADAPALVSDPHRGELEELAHRLVGAGATFGFTEVTAAAEDVERLAGLRPALVARADAECRRLLLLALDRLHLAVTADED